jgi:hypothetical protein
MAVPDRIALAAVAVLAALILIGAGMFGAVFDNPQVVHSEAPLAKNTGFQLKPGEAYAYEYRMNNTSVGMTFLVLGGDGCTVLKVAEMRNGSAVCVDGRGNDDTGSNVTLGSPHMVFFKPWMLAVQDGWAWNSTMYLSFGASYERISATSYRTVRPDVFGGRRSHIVEIRSDSGAVEYDWIDDEKRILLRALGEGYEVVLANSTLGRMGSGPGDGGSPEQG